MAWWCGKGDEEGVLDCPQYDEDQAGGLVDWLALHQLPDPRDDDASPGTPG